MRATFSGSEGLARGPRILPSLLSQRNRVVAERLRRPWVVLGDPKAITRDVTRYLLALSVSYGRHRRRTRIASDDRGGAGEAESHSSLEVLMRSYRGPGGECSVAEL